MGHQLCVWDNYIHGTPLMYIIHQLCVWDNYVHGTPFTYMGHQLHIWVTNNTSPYAQDHCALESHLILTFGHPPPPWHWFAPLVHPCPPLPLQMYSSHESSTMCISVPMGTPQLSHYTHCGCVCVCVCASMPVRVWMCVCLCLYVFKHLHVFVCVQAFTRPYV